MNARFHFKPALALALGCAAALALGACQSRTTNRSVDSQKAPIIETTQLAHDLRFDGYDSLSPAQAKALDEYLASIGIAYGDRISVDDRNPSGAAARRAAIAGVVARYGLLIEPAGPVTGGELAPGTVRVLVTRTKASVPGCPDWRRKSNPELSMSTTSNYGCATNSNLAEMIADPNDLIQGKTYPGADGHTTTKAVDVYRRRVPTGFKEGGGTQSAGTGAATSK